MFDSQTSSLHLCSQCLQSNFEIMVQPFLDIAVSVCQLLLLRFLSNALNPELLQTSFATFWNNDCACSTSGSEEEVSNLKHVVQLLTACNAHVKVFRSSTHHEGVEWSFLGRAPSSCVGYIWYDSQRQHVYEIDGTNLDASATHCNYAGPLIDFCAGGKKPLSLRK